MRMIPGGLSTISRRRLKKTETKIAEQIKNGPILIGALAWCRQIPNKYWLELNLIIIDDKLSKLLLYNSQDVFVVNIPGFAGEAQHFRIQVS